MLKYLDGREGVIDEQIAAIHEAGVIAHQEQGHPRHLFRLAYPALLRHQCRFRCIDPKRTQHRHLEPTAQPAWSMRGSVMELAFESFGAAVLSPREQMVVQLILRGHSSASIGENLAIAEGTVKNHRKSIYAKLNISSQQELFHQFITHMLS